MLFTLHRHGLIVPNAAAYMLFISQMVVYGCVLDI